MPSRLIDGLTGGNIAVAQAYISDVTDAKNRARGLRLIGAAFGLGFIFGPALGGVLSQDGYALTRLQLDEWQTGYSLTYAGVWVVLIQAGAPRSAVACA